MSFNESLTLLKPYLCQQHEEISQFNQTRDIKSNLLNGRWLNNLGLFRAYALAYLKDHASIREDMTLIVRYLQPHEHGLPIEFYAFSKELDWAGFEDLQSDLLDHFIAVLPVFHLALFQRPTGMDVHAHSLEGGGTDV